MFRRIFLTAIVAGILGGLAISAVQHVTTTPLIHHAELYESGAVPSPDAYRRSGVSLVAPALAHGAAEAHGTAETHGAAGAHDGAGHGAAWAPGDGLERALYTLLADILTGVGFALILTACFALWGRPVDGRTGVLWGLAGFAVAALAPAVGLPPEVPGSMAAELTARQTWWLGCAAATAAGLWMMVFRRGTPWIAGGIVLMALPHLVGAPRPEHMGGPVPPELAAHFVAASLATAAIFWCLLGWLSGTLWDRLGRTG